MPPSKLRYSFMQKQCFCCPNQFTCSSKFFNFVIEEEEHRSREARSTRASIKSNQTWCCTTFVKLFNFAAKLPATMNYISVIIVNKNWPQAMCIYCFDRTRNLIFGATIKARLYDGVVCSHGTVPEPHQIMRKIASYLYQITRCWRTQMHSRLKTSEKCENR